MKQEVQMYTPEKSLTTEEIHKRNRAIHIWRGATVVPPVLKEEERFQFTDLVGAPFDGLAYALFGFGYLTVKELKYHSSYDWLMQVAEQIFPKRNINRQSQTGDTPPYVRMECWYKNDDGVLSQYSRIISVAATELLALYIAVSDYCMDKHITEQKYMTVNPDSEYRYKGLRLKVMDFTERDQTDIELNLGPRYKLSLEGTEWAEQKYTIIDAHELLTDEQLKTYVPGSHKPWTPPTDLKD